MHYNIFFEVREALFAVGARQVQRKLVFLTF